MSGQVAKAAGHTQIGTGAVFSWALILATAFPFTFIGLAAFYPVLASGIAVLLAIASTHVVATTYLLTDRSVRHFFAANKLWMIGIPAALLFGGLLLLCRPGPIFMASTLLFFLWQTWHFGAQNIGVVAFISLAERGRSLAKTEKIAIRLGVIAGMLGVLHAMSPGFMIGEEYMPLTPSITAALHFFYWAGAVAAVPITGLGFFLAVRAWRRLHPLSTVTLFLSVTFLFPMYVSHDYVLGFLSFTIAHGLQYLVFLLTHGIGGTAVNTFWRSPLRFLIGPTALLAVMVIAHFVQIYLPLVTTMALPTIGIAFLLSLTVSHFWVDQFLWRMKHPDRAAWIKSRFGFVLQTR